MAFRTRARRVGRICLKAFAALLAVYLLLTAGVWAVAVYRERQVRHAWAEMGLPIDKPPVSPPEWKPSQAYQEAASGLAEQLERRSSALTLVPSKGGLTSEQKGRLSTALDKFVAERLAVPDVEASAARPAVGAFLDDNAQTIATLATLVVSEGGLPWKPYRETVWPYAGTDIEAPPVPGSLAYMSEEFQNLFLAFAIRQADLGHWDENTRALEAAYLLNLSKLSAGMSSWEIDKAARESLKEAVFLRQLPDLPPAWEKRLTIAPFLAALSKSREREAANILGPACAWQDLGNSDLWFGPFLLDPLFKRGPMGWALGKLLRAYIAEDVRRQELRAPTYPWVKQAGPNPWATGSSGASSGWFYLKVLFSWDFFPADYDPHEYILSWLELHQELARKVLLARSARAANGGRWPARIPGIETCECCPGERWIYSAEPAGYVSIRFARPLEVRDWLGIPALEFNEVPAVAPPPKR